MVSLEEWESVFDSHYVPSDEHFSRSFAASREGNVNGRPSSYNKRTVVLVLSGEGASVAKQEQISAMVVAAGGTYQPAVRGGRYAVVTADVDTISRLHLQMQDALRGVVHMRGGMKISRSVNELACEGNGEGNGDGEERKGLLVMLQQMDESSFQESISWLQQLGSEHGWSVEAPSAYHAKSSGVVGVGVGCSSLRESALLLAELEWVRWIEPRPTFRLLNKYARPVTQSGSAGGTPMYDAGLSGENEIVGVADSGIDLNHCFFQDTSCDPIDQLDTTCRKVIYYKTFTDDGAVLDDNGHGTHVTGSIAGECIDSCSNAGGYHGVAFNARLAFVDLSNADDKSLVVPTPVSSGLFTPLYDQGARIQSHSWGTDADKYSTMDQQSDQFMFNNPEALLVFAAGNSGDLGKKTLVSPGIAKNVLTVGAGFNAHKSFSEGTPKKYRPSNVAGFSSRGPTEDGRLKPDVCAPGDTLVSAKSNIDSESQCKTISMAGTSMATPITAGNAVLIREYFRSGYYPTGVATSANGFTPSGALLKATLLHSAQQMNYRVTDDATESIDYPGPEQGYGRIWLDQVLVTSNSNYFSLIVRGDVNSNDHQFTSSGQQHDISLQMTADDRYQRPLIATLVWTDQPGDPALAASVNQLVNDLDLIITDTDTNTVYRPLLLDADSSKDSMNPVEKIVIATPVLRGNYTVSVKTAGILMGTQPYALVITGTFFGKSYSVPKDDSDDDDGLFGSYDQTTVIIAIIVICFVLGLLLACIRRCCRRKQQQARDNEMVNWT